MFKRILKSFLFTVCLGVAITAQAQSVKELFRQANDPVVGNHKGLVTVVEFFDYQCSHCVSMSPIIASIIKANPNVRVVFKEFPIRGPMSEFAARAALAANQQGKYYEFNHTLMASNQPLTEEFIFDAAKGAGLNVEKLKKEMNSRSVNNQLNANYRLAQNLNLAGTPAFFIGKTSATNPNDVILVMGEMTQSELQKAIDKFSK